MHSTIHLMHPQLGDVSNYSYMPVCTIAHKPGCMSTVSAHTPWSGLSPRIWQRDYHTIHYTIESALHPPIRDCSLGRYVYLYTSRISSCLAGISIHYIYMYAIITVQVKPHLYMYYIYTYIYVQVINCWCIMDFHIAQWNGGSEYSFTFSTSHW